MQARPSGRPRPARVLGACALLAWSLAASAGAQALRRCARLVVADAASEAPAGGALLDVDPSRPVDQNTATAGTGGGNVTLSHVAVAPGRVIYATDIDADPAMLGPDPNGGPGRGAVFELDAAGGPLRVVSDGTACGSTITNCGPGGVFVDPVGAAWSTIFDRLLVVDPDADPSGLGRDTNGFAGRGGLFSVDPLTGTVDLIADGSIYPAGLPPGQLSIFEDPVAVTVERDGTIWVADQLAVASPGLPPGTLFRVDAATGTVTALQVPIVFGGLRDIAAESAGTLLVLDRLAGNSGQLLRIDTMGPAGVLGSFAGPELVDPVGVVAAGNGEVWLLDAAADPLGAGRSGAVFRLDAALNTATAVSSTDQFAFPWSLDLLEPEVIDAIVPASAEQGQSLTLRLTGGTFLDPPTIDLGPGVSVDAVRWLSFTEVEVDVTVDAAATPGTRDVKLTNPDRLMAFHCDLFEVTSAPGCAPAAAVGDSLRVSRRGGDLLRLEWDDDGDSCVGTWGVFSSSSARPAAQPGSFPDDPAFADLTFEDLAGDAADTVFERAAEPGRSEYFLIVPIGTDGSRGPPGHYP